MARNAKVLNAMIARQERNSRPVTDRSLSADHVSARVELGRRAGSIPSGRSKAIRKDRTGGGRRAAIRQARED